MTAQQQKCQMHILIDKRATGCMGDAIDCHDCVLQRHSLQLYYFTAVDDAE